MPLFVFDADIWIRIGRNHPPDIFLSLWERLDAAIGDSYLRSPEEVLHELRQGSDDLAARLEQKNGLFVPLEPDIQAASREVINRFGLHDPTSDRNRADPFVVAVARARGGIVVTGEAPRRSDTAPYKIPDACRELGLECLGWFDFLRRVGWRL